MSPSSRASAAARYDHALRHLRKGHRLPPESAPHPSRDWPKENIVLLEQYRKWLLGGGTGVQMVDLIYVPTAGDVCGLMLTPHSQWNLDAAIRRGLKYLQARRLSVISTKIRRNALEKFRRFLHQMHGRADVTFRTFNRAYYCEGLPDWLVQQLERYQHLCQRNWRPARIIDATNRFWSGHVRLWRWLVAHCGIAQLTDLRRQHLFDYAEARLTEGYSVRTINGDFRYLRGFLFFLQDQDYVISRGLFRVPVLQQPEYLPRFLTDDQVCRLRDDLERRVARQQTHSQRRDALLDRATFYLMWQCGLRLGEVEELHMDDLDLAGRKLMVRQGKGEKDRAVYLTDTTVQALQVYLEMRGAGPTNHVFFYRQRPLQKDLIRARIQGCGARVGVAVSPHKLRHTYATQLLGAGCRVTTIQKLMGHRQLGTTMVYAKVHDQNAASDYYAAMARIEARLELDKGVEVAERLFIHPFTRAALLALANRLADPQLRHKARLELIDQMRSILDGKVLENVEMARA